MSEWHPDYQAGKNGWTHYYPTDSEIYKKGVKAREGDNGDSGLGGGGNGGGGGGIILLGLILLPFLIMAALFIAITFPVATLLTILVGFLAMTLWSDPHVDALMKLFILVLPAIVVFMVSMKAERHIEQFTIYRWIRHGIRVIGFGYLSYELLQIFGPGPRPLAADMSPFQLILLTLGIMIATHFGSRWLDNRSAMIDR